MMQSRLKENRSTVCAMILGVAVFIYIYGIRILNPQYIDWLYEGGDLTQHYLGWVAYRNSKWFFPLGLTDQLAYPFTTSIIFTDSIPLLAVFFKLFSPVLPADFQYFGMWGITTFALNGALGAKILQKYLKKDSLAVLGSMFFVFSFQVLQRMYGHTALAGHWIILLSIYALVYYDRKTIKFKTAVWALIGFLCASVHLYFLLMCGIILIGFCILEYVSDQENDGIRKLVSSMRYLLVYVVTAFCTLYLLGAFSSGASASGDGLGAYSLNLNGFFDSQGYSVLIKELPRMEGQGEGFAYLGIGMLCMLLITTVTLVVDAIRKKERVTRLALCSVVIFCIAFAFALSPKITLGDKVLVDMQYPELIRKLWGIFRATGRVAWVCVYLLFSYALCADYKVVSAKIKEAIIIGSLFLQIVDIGSNVEWRHQKWWGEQATYQAGIDEAMWNMLAEDAQIEHVVMVDDLLAEQNYSISIWALENQVSINRFYFARNMGDKIANALTESLSEPQDHTAYVWKKDDVIEYGKYDLFYYDMGDNYIVGGTYEVDALKNNILIFE